MFSKSAHPIRQYITKISENGPSAIYAMLGPVAVAGAHFLVSLLLIPHVSATEFGIFAFAMVLLQLGAGFSDGLLGSPMSVAQASAEKRAQQCSYIVFAFINWIYCAFFAAASFIILLWFTDSFTAAVFSFFIMVMTFRWFGRSYLLTIGNRNAVNKSDILYSGSLIVALGLISLIADITLERVVSMMVMAAAISTPFLGSRFFSMQLKATRWALMRDFMPIWKNQAGWSIIAVLANAATIESHVFVVTFIAGPQSVAPIALAALFFRPSLIGIYALTQTERPKIARTVLKEGIHAAKTTTKTFVSITTTLWLINAVLAGAISICALHLVMNDGYDVSTVRACVLSLAAVMAARCIRQPILAFLQATNQFRLVAKITLYVAPLSLIFASAGLWIAGAVGSILGLLIADTMLLAAMLFYYTNTQDITMSVEGAKQ